MIKESCNAVKEVRLDFDLQPIADSYSSPDLEPSWFSTTFPAFSFYRNIVRIVLKGSSLAKRGLYDDVAWCGSSEDTIRSLERVGIPLKVEGVENLRSVDGPCVLVGNHMSTLETFVMPFLVCPYIPVTFVIKKSLVEYPVFKHIMRSRNPVVVSREKPKEDLRTMLTEGQKRLSDGMALIVFPQTTRGLEFKPEEFNSIAVKIAKRAGVPVLPVALKTNAWGNGKLVKDFGKVDPSQTVHFSFGEAMLVEGNGAEQQAKVVSFIQEKLASWS